MAGFCGVCVWWGGGKNSERRIGWIGCRALVSNHEVSGFWTPQRLLVLLAWFMLRPCEAAR